MCRVASRDLLVVFAIFAVVMAIVFGIHAIITPGMTTGEAHLLWIVRDPEPVTFGNMLGSIPRNFVAIFSRATLDELPTAFLLDLWTAMFGHSLTSLRVAGVVTLVGLLASVGWIIIAGLYLARPLVRLVYGGMILLTGLVVSVLVCAVLAVLGPYVANTWIVDFVTNYPPSAIIECYTMLRPLDEPVLTVFGGDTILGYYDSRQNLRGGIAIDLSQRAYSSEELAAVVATLGEAPVWVMVDGPGWYGSNGTWDALQDVLLATGRVSTFQLVNYQGFPVRNTSVIRYDFAPIHIGDASCGRPISNQISGTVNLAREAGMLAMALGVTLVVRRRRISRRRSDSAAVQQSQDEQ